MARTFIRLIMLLLCCLPGSLLGQYTYFTNTQQIQIPDIGAATPYPSLITVSGQPPYLTNLSVNFESVYHDNGLGDIDILLEAPDGQKVIIFSDALEGQGIFVLLNSVRFASDIYRPFSYLEVVNGQVLFQPTNFAPNPDTFPFPGPGEINQPVPSFHGLDGINPNGVWKLWVVGDNANTFKGYIGYDNPFAQTGWGLGIEASNTKPCARPDLPTLDLIEDTYVQASWVRYDNQSASDLYYGLDTIPPPQANTIPTLENVGNNTKFQINNLAPNRQHLLWVRGKCGNGQTSDWVGPLKFRTNIYPCQQVIPTTMCETVQLSTLPSFNYWKPASCAQYVEDESPKRILQFTAPVTGTYTLQSYAIYPGHIAYKASSSLCDTSGWTCLTDFFPNYYMSINLVADTTYWFFIDGGVTLKFDLCPPLLDLTNPHIKPISVTPTKGSFRWIDEEDEPLGITGQWDLYFARQSDPPPSFETTPTISDLKRDTFGNFKLNQALQASQSYNLFMRQRCSDTWGCWSKPMPFFTPPVIAVATNVRLDSTISYPGTFNAAATMHWETLPDSFASHWKASWNVKPYLENTADYMIVSSGTPVDYHINDLHTSTTYDLWLRAVHPIPTPYDYWEQDGQGPFSFTTGGPLLAVQIDPIFCNQLIAVPAATNFNVFSPPSSCGDTIQTNKDESVWVFKSTQSGPVAIRPRGANGAPGSKISVHYKKKSAGYGISGWTLIDCWEMGQVQPVLYFNTEKDSTYYLLFDTYAETPFSYNFEIEQCDVPCKNTTNFKVIHSDANSVTISWEHPDPTAVFDIECTFASQGVDYPDWVNPKVKGSQERVLTLTGLEQDAVYDIFLRTHCGNGASTTTLKIEDVPTGSDHPFVFKAYLFDCVPAAPRPFGVPGLEYRYEALPFTVTESGNYKILSFLTSWPGNFLAVYEDSYNENDPYENLIAHSDTNLVAIGIKDGTLALKSGTQYYLRVFDVAPVASGNESVSFYKYVIRGPGFAQMKAPVFNARLARPHGKIWEADGTIFSQLYTCADTTGWIHFFAGQPAQRKDHYLLFSVKSYDALNNYYYFLPYGRTGGAGGATLIQNPPALYATNTSGWYVMNRFWDLPITIDQEPQEPVLLRYYYTEQDFQALRDAVIAAGGIPPDTHEQLYFYKINDFFDQYNPDPAQGHANVPKAIASNADGYWEYANGPVASDTTWRYDTFKNGHVAEMVVRHFSGGGGGIGTNLKGATIISVPTAVSQLQLKIYPNPSADWLHIEGLETYGKAHIAVRSLLGNLLLEQHLNAGEAIHIQALTPGIYWLTIKTEQGVGVWKIVKN